MPMQSSTERGFEPPFPVPVTGNYEPEDLSDEVMLRVKEEMRHAQVQLTPANVRHAVEAEEIRMLLREYDIKSMHKVSATRDGSGMVRIPFSEFRALVNGVAEDAFKDGLDRAP